MEDKTIHQKLIEVQEELKAPKGQYNSFGKYYFRSTEDIVEALKPLLIKRGLLLLMYDEIELVGSRIYVVSTADLTDGATNIKVSARARESETKKGMDASQLTGSTSSYAAKYALNGLFLIDDTKDADATNNHGNDQKNENKDTNKSNKQQQKEESKKITIDTYLEAIRKYEKEYQTEIKDYLVDKALMEIEDLNFEQAKELAIAPIPYRNNVIKNKLLRIRKS